VLDAAAFDFVREHTRVTRLPLLPELRFWLSEDVTQIWLACERALGVVNPPPPYWAFCWPGSQALARWLLDHPEHCRGRRVFDFAAGCGAGALAAARCGAARVLANDIDPLSIAALQLNAALNDVAIEPDLADRIGEEAPAWDLVLAGDVFYEQELARRLAPWLRHLAARGVEVLVADPGRNFFSPSGLAPLATYTVPTTQDLESRDERQTTLFRVL